MRLSGPATYDLLCETAPDGTVSVRGKGRFSGLATVRKPKLYIVSSGGYPVYVGVTRQTMSARFRLGSKSAGETGYYGYRFRHHLPHARLDIWCHDDAGMGPESNVEMETVEAEVVFLIRQDGQWPAFQTEIHFYPSSPEHRKHALAIFAHYKARMTAPGAPTVTALQNVP